MFLWQLLGNIEFDSEKGACMDNNWKEIIRKDLFERIQDMVIFNQN